MSKNVKIIIIVAVAALVIGLIIFFYKKKKKGDAASKVDSNPVVTPSPAAVHRQQLHQQEVRVLCKVPAYLFFALQLKLKIQALTKNH